MFTAGECIGGRGSDTHELCWLSQHECLKTQVSGGGQYLWGGVWGWGKSRTNVCWAVTSRRREVTNTAAWNAHCQQGMAATACSELSVHATNMTGVCENWGMGVSWTVIYKKREPTHRKDLLNFSKSWKQHGNKEDRKNGWQPILFSPLKGLGQWFGGEQEAKSYWTHGGARAWNAPRPNYFMSTLWKNGIQS